AGRAGAAAEAAAAAEGAAAAAAAETEAEWAAKAAGRAAAKAKAAAAGSSGFDWQPYLDALDAALKIGPQAPPIKPIVAKERLSVLQEAGGTAK
ncbi:MAG: hypothetical protein OEZ19_03985, partial [Paracoccaceae bacterium]|nr:hypothetical protein [Paracoccaceae bacterium]